MPFFYKILLIIDKKKFDDIFASKIVHFIKKFYFYQSFTYTSLMQIIYNFFSASWHFLVFDLKPLL